MDSYRGLDKLIPEMQTRTNLFLSDVKAKGISIIITETWRSQERQKYLYSLGRTQPGQIVTWTLESKHLLGEAIDVAFLVNGKLSYDGDWEQLAAIGEAVGLSWGGRWKTPDQPHFQFNHDFMPPKPEWYVDAQKFVIAKGISNGERPNDPVTRAEVWQMILKSMANS